MRQERRDVLNSYIASNELHILSRLMKRGETQRLQFTERFS